LRYREVEASQRSPEMIEDGGIVGRVGQFPAGRPYEVANEEFIRPHDSMVLTM
jgi:hypothetical protein